MLSPGFKGANIMTMFSTWISSPSIAELRKKFDRYKKSTIKFVITAEF